MKKIISVVLIFPMLFAMCVTASAASITTAEPYTMVKWEGATAIDDKGTVVTDPVVTGTLYPTSGINTAKYGISVLSGGVQNPGVTSVERAAGDICYNVNRANDLRYDPSTNFNFYSQVTSTKLNKPVFSVMYDIMIPVGDTENTARTFTATFAGSNGKSGANGTNPAQFTIKYENKKFTIDQTAELFGFDTTSAVYADADYTPGSWATVEVRAYYDATTTMLTYGAYVDDTKIFYAEGNIAYGTTVYLDRALWHQPSLPTNYDNIWMRTLAIEDKPTTFTVQEPEPEEPEEPEVPTAPELTRLVLWNFDELTTTPTNATVIASYVSDGNLLYNPKTIALSTDTNRNTDYVGEERADNGKALVVTTGTTTIDELNPSTYTVIVNNARRNYNTYVKADGNEYVVEHSHEIFIPADSADTKRTYQFGFNLTGQATNDYFIEANTENGKLDFDIKPLTENVKVVDFTERTKTADVASDAWNKISFIKSITYDVNAGLYNIKIYGMLNDVCYYEAQVKGYNASDLYMVTQSWNIKGLDDKAVVTKLDNVKISSWSAMPEITYAWTDSENFIYPLAINEVDGGVEVKAKAVGTYSNLCLVAAVFNGDGRLEKLWTDTTLEDGYLSYKVTGSEYVKSGYTVKGFLFDSLTSLIPYVENAVLVID